MPKSTAALAFLALAAFGSTAQAQTAPIACPALFDKDKVITLDRTTVGDPRECANPRTTRVVDTLLGVVGDATSLRAVAPTSTNITSSKNCATVDLGIPAIGDINTMKWSDIIELFTKTKLEPSVLLWTSDTGCVAPTSRIAHRRVKVELMKMEFSICYEPTSGTACIPKAQLTEAGQKNLMDFIGPRDIQVMIQDAMKGVNKPI